MAILLAEDDRALSALICDFFRAANLEVLPVYDGLSVCRELRKTCAAPVIFVTALGQEYDQLAGYRAGADDYITKPFSFPVLVAKAQAVLRRASGRGWHPARWNTATSPFLPPNAARGLMGRRSRCARRNTRFLKF